MGTSTYVFILVNFCTLLIDLANLKPVPDLETQPVDVVPPAPPLPFAPRVRRRASASPTDVVYNEDVNSAALESGSYEPNQDSEKGNDMSSFALSDPMPEFFRSHKDKETQQLPPQENQGSPVQREALPADEQMDCYEQQNIDPPGNSLDPQRPFLRLKDQRPFSDVFQNQDKILTRPLLYKEKSGLRDKNGVDEITSLYSNAEKRRKLKKTNSVVTKQNTEELHEPSVYKPVGVRPEFPIYDEDIDFHPDPLQGILEDKYWQDPQEQEAVIRKYIDLAAHMQPPTLQYAKRDVQREYEPRSVDSKEAFRDADAVDKGCPCREIVACGDCSKGKWSKKPNITETNDVGSLYGTYEKRKLLSIDEYGSGIEGGSSIPIDEEGELYKIDSEVKIVQSKNDKVQKHSSEGYQAFEYKEEESGVDGDVPSFTSKYFGRRLLSIESDDNVDEDYAEYEDSDIPERKAPHVQTHDHRVINFKTERIEEYGDAAQKVYKRHSTSSDDEGAIKDKVSGKRNQLNPLVDKPSNNEVYDHNLEAEKTTDDDKNVKPNLREEFLQMQSPFFGGPHNMAKYYVPNKLGNILQKSMNKKKPVEKPTTIDPDLEFQIGSNETRINVSIAMNDINVSVTTETAELVKNNKRREQPISMKVKGRRSYDLPIIKHPSDKSLQSTDDSGHSNVQGGNITANETSTANTTIPTTLDSNTTSNVTGNNTTETTIDSTTTENATNTGPSTTTKKPKKKIEDYDEDSFDAEIANDIVETVISESHSGSVVGHNLGLYRRNESLSKYAKVSPESELLLKKVTECILNRIRDRLEGQSCTLLDNELLQFLKWMVLSGESYRDYLARIRPEFAEFKSTVHEDGLGVNQPANEGGQSNIPVSSNLTS